MLSIRIRLLMLQARTGPVRIGFLMLPMKIGLDVAI